MNLKGRVSLGDLIDEGTCKLLTDRAGVTYVKLDVVLDGIRGGIR